MPFIHVRPKRRPALGLLALAFAPVVATSPAGAADHPEHRSQQRLVVRGDATVVDGPCDGGVCRLELTDGRFRGTPVGTGAYTGSIRLKVADVFPNGEGGVCAPLKGRIVLGAGTGDRLVLALSGARARTAQGPSPPPPSPASPSSPSSAARAATPARPAPARRASPKTPPTATG